MANKPFDFEGTVIHGTMRSEDLIPAFVGAIEQLVKDRAPDAANCVQTGESIRTTLDEVRSWIGIDLDDDDEEWIMEWLFDTLNYLAPAGYYFGAHPGDGSDFGFWSSEDD